MEKLNDLITKRIKFKPWLILGAFFILLSIIYIIAIPIIVIRFIPDMKNNIFPAIFLVFILFAIGIIPFIMAQSVEYKIGCEIKNIFCSRLKECINDDNVFKSLFILVKETNIASYSIVVAGDAAPLNVLSKTVKKVISDITVELNYRLVLTPVILKTYS